MADQPTIADRIRAIPVSVTGPDGHPDLRIARICAEAAEAMRSACLRIVEEAGK